MSGSLTSLELDQWPASHNDALVSALPRGVRGSNSSPHSCPASVLPSLSHSPSYSYICRHK